MRVLAIVAMAGAIGGGAAPAAAQDWSAAATASVELSNFRFRPASLVLKRGVPYRIRFVNGSMGGHDFVARDFFEEANIAPPDRAKLRNGGIDLGGGESAEIRIVANRAGTYKVHCSHFMHSMMGMTGTVTVE